MLDRALTCARRGPARMRRHDVRTAIPSRMLVAPNFWAFRRKFGTSRIYRHKIATDADMRSNSGVRQVCAAIARRGVRPSFRSVRPGYVRVRTTRREGQLGPLSWGGGMGSRGGPSRATPIPNHSPSEASSRSFGPRRKLLTSEHLFPQCPLGGLGRPQESALSALPS